MQIKITEQREEINIHAPANDMLILMAEGNPGAISVLAQLLKEDEGILAVFALDDMNIRGTQIWIGFKDYCGTDLKKFMDYAINRNKEMINAINREGVKGNHTHKAVSNGASFGEREFLKNDDLIPNGKPKRMIRLED